MPPLVAFYDMQEKTAVLFYSPRNRSGPLFVQFITQSCSVNYRCCFLVDLKLHNVDRANVCILKVMNIQACVALYDCEFRQTVTSPTRLDNILDLVLVIDSGHLIT